MKHPAISKHRMGQWQYWGNVGDHVGNHMLIVREMARGKMVEMLEEIPKDIEGHWRGDRRCQKNDWDD